MNLKEIVLIGALNTISCEGDVHNYYYDGEKKNFEEKVVYTCQSGADLIAEKCCQPLGWDCYLVSESSSESIISSLLEECNEEIVRGKSMQPYFECFNQVCSVEETRTEEHFEQCEKLWP